MTLGSSQLGAGSDVQEAASKIVLLLSAAAAISSATATVLESNPFRARHLFLAELQVRDVVVDVRDALELAGVGGEDAASIEDEISWFTFSHDIVLDELSASGVRSAEHLEQMGDDGMAIVEEKLVGNALHIYRHAHSLF